MSEEAAPEQVQDQPVEDAPAPAADQAEPVEAQSFTNFNLNEVPDEHRQYVEQAYKQLQGDYTRKRQADSQAAREAQERAEQYEALFSALENPETQAEALAALGFDLEQADGPGLVENPELDPHQIQQVMSEWEQFKAQQQEQEMSQYLESMEQELFSEIDAKTKHLGGLPETVRDAIFDHALAIELTEDGQVDVARAVKDFEDDVFSWAQERYVNSKREAAQAPAGSSGQAKVDMADEGARVGRLAALISRPE